MPQNETHHLETMDSQGKNMLNPKADSTRKKAVFIDLDGTLWDREVVPASAWKAIEKARANGHLIFVNTGRRHVDIPKFLWDANFDGYCLATGMQMFKGKELLCQSYIDPEKVKKMIAYLKSQDSGYGLEGNDWGFDDPKYAFRRMIFFAKEDRKDPSIRYPLSHIEPENYDELVKIIFDSDKPYDLEPVAKELGFDILQYKNRFNPSGGVGSFFRGELTDAHHNKAKAMKEMLEAMGVAGQYDIAAIGDSENDIPMLEAADYAICMGNGTPATKEKADYVTTSLDQDGLYNAFAWLGLFEPEKNTKENEQD